MRRMFLLGLATFGMVAMLATSPRAAERPGRGLIATPAEDGAVYLSWRLLADDPNGVAFNVYQGADDPRKLNDEPIRATTDLTDSEAPAGRLTYTVRAVVNGRETGPAATTTVERPRGDGDEAGPYQVIKLGGDATVQKAGIADLDGDGRFDFVLKGPNSNVDPYENYWKRSPGTYTLSAYSADGSPLWTHDLGWSIEQGIWYSPYVVYDLDGDGKAEVAVKTGEGDPRDETGRVQTGPEYLSILDGRTGELITRADWPSRQPFYDAMPGQPLRGYNYASRNQLGIAYLDGKTPHLILGRGTYNIMVVIAYRLDDGKLREVWRWDNTGLGREYQGQGAHSMFAVDVDGDGKQEVILGSLVLDDDGTPLWTTGMGHPDFAYIGDIDPKRPGLEIYYGYESRQQKNGMCLVDAATGKILWGLDAPTRHVHGQGLCADIDARFPGSECYGADTDSNKDFAYARLHSAQGQLLGDENLGGFSPRVVYWNADPQRELIRKDRIFDYDDDREEAVRIRGSLIAVADILGDWREEILTTAPGELRIYTTTVPARSRHVSLIQDPIYRACVAHASMGYYQMPMLSKDLATAEAESE